MASPYLKRAPFGRASRSCEVARRSCCVFSLRQGSLRACIFACCDFHGVCLRDVCEPCLLVYDMRTLFAALQIHSLQAVRHKQAAHAPLSPTLRPPLLTRQARHTKVPHSYDLGRAGGGGSRAHSRLPTNISHAEMHIGCCSAAMSRWSPTVSKAHQKLPKAAAAATHSALASRSWSR
jgi:hypothetical protein